jgi:hypothetical protein
MGRATLMRAGILLLVLAGPARAGPIRVGVETEGPVTEPFLVRVYGHYASIHNGTSRHWKDALLPGGGRHFVPLGPVNPLLNMGVSVSIYHPAYVSEHARSHETPLLLRPVGFDTFRPRSWQAIMESREEFANGGPEQFLGQALGHLQTFVEGYLPALDAGDAPTPPDALRSHLPLLREIARFAESDEASESRDRWSTNHTDPEFVRALARQDLESRALLREWLRRAEAWLSVPREQRIEVRERMAQMRYPKSVGEELLGPSDLTELADLARRDAEDREAGREPEGSTSWTNPETRVSYRASLDDGRRSCPTLSLTTDLTTLVDADLGDMTKTVTGRLCRNESGSWGFGRR